MYGAEPVLEPITSSPPEYGLLPENLLSGGGESQVLRSSSNHTPTPIPYAKLGTDVRLADTRSVIHIIPD